MSARAKCQVAPISSERQTSAGEGGNWSSLRLATEAALMSPLLQRDVRRVSARLERLAGEARSHVKLNTWGEPSATGKKHL